MVNVRPLVRDYILNVSGIGRLNRQVTIGMLPDEVLLEIFDFYIDELGGNIAFDAWHLLVHVCRRWRNLVFISPRRLNLKLRCTYRRSVEKMLDIWPELPIVIEAFGYPPGEGAVDALGLKHRMSYIRLWGVPNSLLQKCAVMMQDPFPVLTDLHLWLASDMDPIVISDSFLGGSAPSLQWVHFSGISFPGLPNLLLSATNLSYLCFEGIPHFGYISPEAMVTCLSGLTRLEQLYFKFQSSQSRPDRASRLPPPLTRTLLPALTHISIQGITEYLEDLVSRIDVLSLKGIAITLFYQPVFDILELHDFVRRGSKFAVLDKADIVFAHSSVYIVLSPQFGAVDLENLKLGISCGLSESQLSSLVQICVLCKTTLSTLRRLAIRVRNDLYFPPDLPDDTAQWHQKSIFSFKSAQTKNYKTTDLF